MPAGRWRLAWCCHQGILGGVCRKGRGVNWVSAGCKALWVKAWYSSSWCFVTHSHPERYRWWVRWGCRRGEKQFGLLFCSILCLYQDRVLHCVFHGCSFFNSFVCCPCFSLWNIWFDFKEKNEVCKSPGERWDLGLWWCWPRVNRFTP